MDSTAATEMNCHFQCEQEQTGSIVSLLSFPAFWAPTSIPFGHSIAREQAGKAEMWFSEPQDNITKKILYRRVG